MICGWKQIKLSNQQIPETKKNMEIYYRILRHVANSGWIDELYQIEYQLYATTWYGLYYEGCQILRNSCSVNNNYIIFMFIHLTSPQSTQWVMIIIMRGCQEHQYNATENRRFIFLLFGVFFYLLLALHMKLGYRKIKIG